MGRLRIEAVAAACDHGPDGEVGVFAACHRYRREWEVTVRVAAEGTTELVLDLPAD